MVQPYYHPPVKRSITIAGHATSISLEPVFWDWLKTEAATRQIPINALVAQIDLERMQSDTPPGLASAVRLWLAAQLQQNAQAEVTFRWANGEADYTRLGQLMFDAVHALPSPYSEDERIAWMPEPRSGPVWNGRLAKQNVLLAETDGNEALGFVSLEQLAKAGHAYVDFAYIAGPVRGSGLFRALYEQIEDEARAQGKHKLETHASLMAQPAFAAMGFAVLHEEQVEMASPHGPQKLRRFAMCKSL